MKTDDINQPSIKSIYCDNEGNVSTTIHNPSESVRLHYYAVHFDMEYDPMTQFKSSSNSSSSSSSSSSGYHRFPLMNERSIYLSSTEITSERKYILDRRGEEEVLVG